ncbi:hypothetical protein RAC89_17995 [Paenibacillus sp. GD4]|jgi:hypothetical protein|uniref:hypothetical protein n=1 Tax=Paenibacillus sp. GD4 TaxID=3068890 RepID=UPI002796C2DD|nr:hypothetical protein [Paenibacillus sp. GD4]MDQ1912284.1 hypothetical protein [Paenibacillus sp. GD4]
MSSDRVVKMLLEIMVRRDRRVERRIRKQIRRLLSGLDKDVSKRVRRDLQRLLARTIRNEVRGILYSEQFARFLREAIGQPQQPLAELARRYMEEQIPVSVLTPSGSVEGIITNVGVDFIVVREPRGSIVVVHLDNTLAIQPTGLE